MKSGTVEAALGRNYIQETPTKKSSFSIFFSFGTAIADKRWKIWYTLLHEENV